MTTRATSATLITGDTGTGKTNLLASLADWEYQRCGALSDYYCTDGGGWGDYMQALIDLGIVRAVRLYTRDPGDRLGLAFETMSLATQGWWPAEFTTPEQGEVPAGVAMLPPVTTVYTLSCPKGHQVYSGAVPPSTSILCKCGEFVTLQTGKVTALGKATPGFPEKRVLLYDGLTSGSGWAMRDLASRVGRQELGGEESAIGGKIRSGGMSYGGSNRSHYGFAQLRCEEWLLNSATVPGLTRPPIWTALERRAMDSDLKIPIYGPQIPGVAKTSEVPAWVGNALGTCVVKNAKGEDEWRLYTTEYVLDDGIPHLCKTRATPGLLPKYLCDASGQKPFTGFNLGRLFEMLDAALDRTKKELEERYKALPAREPLQGTATVLRDLGVPVPVQAPMFPTTVPMVGGPSGPLPASPSAGSGRTPGVPPPPAAPAPAPQVGGSPGAPLPPAQAPFVPNVPAPQKRKKS